MIEKNTIDNDAEKISSFLRILAFSDVKKRAKMLQEMDDSLRGRVSLHALNKLVDRNFQRTLLDAVSMTLNTRVIDFQGVDRGIPWTKDHIVIATSESGILKGVSVGDTILAEPEKLSGRLIGTMRKAGLVQLLDTAELLGGFTKHGNIRYLNSLGFTLGENMYLGAAPYAARFGQELVYFASGACHAKKDYLRGLLGNAEPTSDTQAGVLERWFAEITIMYMHQLTDAAKLEFELFKLPEPNDITKIRMGN